MKYFYIGIFIFAVLLSACFLSSRQIRKQTGELECALHRALAASEEGDASRSTYHTDRALRLWSHSRKLFSCFLSHVYTEEISEDLNQLPALGGEEFRKVCRRLLQRLENIRSMDRPIPENIL